MNKDFDTWNGEKNIINLRKVDASYFSGEVWWCNLGLNIGMETDGKNENFERPVVIIKFWNKDKDSQYEKINTKTRQCFT